MLFVSAPISVWLKPGDWDQNDWWLGGRKGKEEEEKGAAGGESFPNSRRRRSVRWRRGGGGPEERPRGLMGLFGGGGAVNMGCWREAELLSSGSSLASVLLT